MAGAGRVELTLLGQTLTVRTEAAPEHLRALAAYLEERVGALRKSGVRDPMAALTLAALDITDELFRAREDRTVDEGDVGSRLGALVLLLEHMGGLEGPPKPPDARQRPGKAVALLDIPTGVVVLVVRCSHLSCLTG